MLSKPQVNATKVLHAKCNDAVFETEPLTNNTTVQYCTYLLTSLNKMNVTIHNANPV